MIINNFSLWFETHLLQDISFLSDKSPRREDLPKSKIPEKDHVKEKSVTPPIDPAIKAVFDGDLTKVLS